MPWKMLMYLILLGVVLAFIGLNMGNTSDISLGFTTFESVPVFMSLFVAFFAGVVMTIPVMLFSSSRKYRQKDERRMTKEERVRLKELRKQEKEAARLQKNSGKKEPASRDHRGETPKPSGES